MTEDRTISLNAVKEMIKGMPDWSITKNAFAYRINVEDLMKGLEDLPPVTPNDEEMAMQYQRGYIDGFKEGKATFEPKTGHWLYIDERKAKCSRCRYIQITGGADKTGHCNIHYGVYKYCTNCGAKMVEPQEVR